LKSISSAKLVCDSVERIDVWDVEDSRYSSLNNNNNNNNIYISSFTIIFKYVNNTSVKIGIVSVKLRDRLVSNVLPLLLYKEEVL
jgi:hypothetical protein